ncbi:MULTISPECIES: transglutaminase family protein [unclassified Imperialibacter]|uniref:transglutaminase family protein n=1 Tax=unclassified Imperialibacter TaxID=2629706 RepID=UPI00125B0505|nr:MULTISPECIES: transglutaminase family protein [unclassified Imperialibacter]CAD5252427.1 Transglutaminase family protein [Imperialibacter sp. 89]CAD5260468.1 Transglutaminase family protein [Imperialibacter sp. 75]VVT04249.1 Transglutaminase domain-containing protein [Imperialibacter sp. EC-SDR9]
MPKFNIRHLTKYTYTTSATNSANEIMLYPIQDDHQEVLQHHVIITGNPDVYVHKDYYGNNVGSFAFADPHLQLLIDSILEVETKKAPEVADESPADEQWKHLYNISNHVPYIDFLRQENFQAIPEVMAMIESVKKQNATPLQAALNLSEYVFSNFSYIKGVTTVETTLDEIWKLKSGVCQDFAHMLLVMLRQLFIPARYVSGYVCPNKNGMRGEGATHAWVEAYIPDHGWVGIDPTNNCLVNDLHVRLAIGRSFVDCSPVKGTYKGAADHTLEVAVSVEYEGGPKVNQDLALEEIAKATATPDVNSFQRYQQIQQQQ